MPAHLLEAPVVLALAADEDGVHRLVEQAEGYEAEPVPLETWVCKVGPTRALMRHGDERSAVGAEAAGGGAALCDEIGAARPQLLVSLREDGGERCLLRFFHPHAALRARLQPGQRIRARGEIRRELDGWQIMHPQCRSASAALPTALTPVYPTSAGLPQAYLRRAIASGLQRVDLRPTVPDSILEPLRLQTACSLREALSFLHQPAPDADCAALERREHPAWYRLQLEELLAQQLSQLLARRQRHVLRARPCAGGPMAGWPVDGLAARLLQRLPFALTAAQLRVVEDIAADLALAQPMHRLLQGDVGSGKTVVAALAAALCLDAGLCCALMVPTEILAGQHATKLMEWLQPLGVPRVSLLGGQRRAERAAVLATLAAQPAALVVGTHALLESDLPLPPLGLAIVDEQHRFGVAQRLRLRAARADALAPHLLMMSATPIPRTLAMTYYADLDISTLDELPPGRSPILTKLVHERRRDEVVHRLGAVLQARQQVYWVCPLIEESEALDVADTQATHAALQRALPGVVVGLLHARLAPAEKQDVMQRFIKGAVQVLVSTTVIEVGVDVPNATLMVIENAERLGLADGGVHIDHVGLDRARSRHPV